MPVRHSVVFVVASCVLPGFALAQVTERINLTPTGAQTTQVSVGAHFSDDGRYAVFESYAPNLVAGDTNNAYDVFVRDRATATTERISIGAAGAQPNDDCTHARISTDGRYVAFASGATTLGVNVGTFEDVFLKDRLTGALTIVSPPAPGGVANSALAFGSMSSNARYFSFSSLGSMTPGDTNGTSDVYFHDRVSGVTERISLTTSGAQPDHGSFSGAVSDDGRYVAFTSWATNLVPGDTNGVEDVFLRDRLLGTTTRASVSQAGTQGNFESHEFVHLSADGRFVCFHSDATNLVAGDTNDVGDIFVRDMQTGVVTRVSTGTLGTQGNAYSDWPFMTRDARHVAFISGSNTWIAGTTFYDHVYVKDLMTGQLSRASVSTSGAQPITGFILGPALSADGRFVGFWGDVRDLVPGDTNYERDVFVHDRGATGFSIGCEPGSAGVVACPCSNPPSSPGRGCDNSAATGGASLSASGNAYLSIDSVTFTSAGQTPSSPSLLVQGTSQSTGAVFGQGVRCVGGTLVRMYTKTASGGSIQAPNLGAGDATISARSAAMGLPITPGQTRYFFVYYRDPFVLGGCSGSSTFNVTATARITYWP